MPDEDTPDEGGLEPAANEAPVDDAPVEEAAPEPEVYTLDQIAEAYGPRWERFASHGGIEAVRQAGLSHESATSLIRQGAHLEPQDPSVYEQIGIDPSEVYQPQPEPEQHQIFGAPWEPPATWDDYLAYAQSDSPDMRRLAAYGVLQSEQADQPTKQWFYNQWAQADPHGAAAYIQQSTVTAAEQRMAEIEARLEAKYSATHQDLLERSGAALTEQAKAAIPGFAEHGPAVAALLQDQQRMNPNFPDYFYSISPEDQMKLLKRLVVIAAAEAEPERQAAASAAADQTDAAKLRTRTEASRTGGAPDTDAAALKRQSIDEAKRVFGQVR